MLKVGRYQPQKIQSSHLKFFALELRGIEFTAEASALLIYNLPL